MEGDTERGALNHGLARQKESIPALLEWQGNG
jgi:hypothetical protein